ncbi:hypothetical protein [Marinicellulosiphila megalodicopiae]|uniref:hypothetical protein n=1 Tax=Marinicellulosiphila megalodicopiae TaxID=2724896 RepID=UPI003BB11D76
MPKYEIKGKGIKTNRMRTRVYEAKTEEEARNLAKLDETTVIEIIKLKPDPATEKQIAYARDLNIVIPPNPTKDGLSELISQAVSKEEEKEEKEKNRNNIDLGDVELNTVDAKQVLREVLEKFNIEKAQISEEVRSFSESIKEETEYYKDSILDAKEELTKNQKLLKEMKLKKSDFSDLEEYEDELESAISDVEDAKEELESLKNDFEKFKKDKRELLLEKLNSYDLIAESNNSSTEGVSSKGMLVIIVIIIVVVLAVITSNS